MIVTRLVAIEERPGRPTASIRAKVPAVRGGQIVGPLVSEILEYLKRARVERTGVPYVRTSWAPGSDIEVGLAVADPVSGDGYVLPGYLPAGRWVVAWHKGPYDQLGPAIAEVRAWIAEKGLHADLPWEFYHSDPSVVTDPAQFETELVFLLQSNG